VKKVFVSLLLFFTAAIGFSQSSPEIVYQQYVSAKTSEAKQGVIDSYIISYTNANLAKAYVSLKEMNEFFNMKGEPYAAGPIQLLLSSLYRETGDYSNSLRYSLPALQTFEKVNDTSRTISSLMEIGDAFTSSENMQQGLFYYKKCKSIIESYHKKSEYPVLLNNMAKCYNKMNDPVSALGLITEAINVGEKNNDKEMLGVCYSTLGETYLAKEDHKLARVYLEKSIDYARKQYSVLAVAYTDLAESYFKTNEYENVLICARNAVWYAEPNYRKELMEAYEWLYKAFEKTDQKDSVNRYFRLALTLKDSLFTIEKNRNLLEMNSQEQLRLQEIETNKIKEEAERKKSLAYSFIGVGIILFIFSFLLLSRSFITNAKIIRVLNIIALLLLFEFINLLLHPFLERITHHSISLMLVAMVCIAALLAPLHHKIEKWAVNKLIEKNKQIRLAAAKKTIEILEGSESKAPSKPPPMGEA